MVVRMEITKQSKQLILTTMLSLILTNWRCDMVQAFSPSFMPNQESHIYSRQHIQGVRPLYVFTEREADLMEQFVGGERFEMSQLPDSMLDSTIFVGNLCEFVDDEDLSKLFRSVSNLQSVPACVIRKPDMTSLQYGFVSFPSPEETTAAILRFHNYEWKGKRLKVEPIKDHPTAGRVRLPERMVSYVSGAVKHPPRKSRNRSGKKPMNSLRRISREDVGRLSRGQPSKKKGHGHRSVLHRLNEREHAELERAQRKGFVTLEGGGGRKTPLANIHRQWCDAQAKPQIALFKNRLLVDKIVVDLAPLRLYASLDVQDVERAMRKYAKEIERIAENAGMQLCRGEDDDAPECKFYGKETASDLDDVETQDIFSNDSATQKAWATKPMWKLPYMIAGEYVGERNQAKAMAKELATMWDIPEEAKVEINPTEEPANHRPTGARKGGKSKMRGLSQHRRRGGGHRQSFY